jgi:hypothetical protein
MSEVMTASPPVERLCKFEEMFDAGFIELIRLVPKNPFIRALILKLSGKMPPDEVETFDQLKDWIEHHCTRRVRPMPNQGRRRNEEGGIAINVEFSETEYGRADYSVPRSGNDEFRIGAEDLIEIVNDVIEAGGSMDEVVDTIAGRIDDDAWSQCDPNMDDYGDYNYSEHESNDSSDSNTDYSREEIRAAVRVFLQEQHPELIEEL